MTMGPELRIRIFEMSVRLGISCFYSQSVIPTESVERRSRSTGEWRDLLCACRASAPQANSRSLDCEDRALRARSSSLGMTEFFTLAASFPARIDVAHTIQLLNPPMSELRCAISQSFLVLFQRFSCFSRSIALFTSSNDS